MENISIWSQKNATINTFATFLQHKELHHVQYPHARKLSGSHIFIQTNGVFAENLPRFLLGPEDILEISVWRDETLTRQVMIMPDGKFSFPLIGDIQASGHTIAEIRTMVQEKIKNMFRIPL